MSKRYMTRKVIFVIALIFLISCSEQLTQEQQEYKEFCAETSGNWMKMSALKDGSPTGETCYGCMTDEKNHLCTKAEYEGFL